MTEAAADAQPPASGSWSGTMDGETHDYSVDLVLAEGPDGSLSARARQVEIDKGGVPTGQTGVEVLTGSRQGTDVTLVGQYFEAGTPASWVVDTMNLKMSEDGSTLAGTYSCSGCTESPVTLRRR